MSLPFTAEQFFEVFRRYNEAVWPAQLALTALAVGAAAVPLVPWAARGRVVSLILAVLWLWMALIYHLGFFLSINPAAALFAAAFVAGAADFVWSGTWRGRLRFAWPGARRGALGVALIVYALAGYALLAELLGQHYPAVPTFGLPCPTTLFTAGILLFLEAPYPRHVLLVPLAWTLVGSQAAFLLGVVQDLALIIAAATLVWLALAGATTKEIHA